MEDAVTSETAGRDCLVEDRGYEDTKKGDLTYLII